MEGFSRGFLQSQLSAVGACWHPVVMNSWTDQLSAWSALATAVCTVLLLVAALIAGVVGVRTLHASRDANVQAKRDSIEQTRPYVYAEVVPSLAGPEKWDLRIVNVGRSAARGLTLTYDSWPEELDDVTEKLKIMFDTERTLPPTCSLRVYWRLEGAFDDGTTEAGAATSGVIGVRYTSDDPSNPTYEESFPIGIDSAGWMPVPESGIEAKGLSGQAKSFHSLGAAISRHVAELRR